MQNNRLPMPVQHRMQSVLDTFRRHGTLAEHNDVGRLARGVRIVGHCHLDMFGSAGSGPQRTKTAAASIHKACSGNILEYRNITINRL